MQKNIFLLIAVIYALGCNNPEGKSGSAYPTHKEDPGLIKEDIQFIIEAANGILMEVELNELISQNAASPKVKEFGEYMIKDHQEANKKLQAIASKKNIPLPQTLNKDHRNHISFLKEKKGTDFDSAFISLMVKEHEEDLIKFEREAQEGKDAEIKAFASYKIPIMQQHLDMARAIDDLLK